MAQRLLKETRHKLTIEEDIKKDILKSVHDDVRCGIRPTQRRCPWCNGYRRRNWTRRHEFKSWDDCISHSTNTLGKGMNPIIGK